jgi:Fe-S cluster assembly protein SufD
MPTTLDTDVRPEDRFVSAFKVNHGQTLNGTTASISNQREHAIERFAQLGLPTKKQEAYKYTNLAKVIDRPYALPLAPEKPPVVEDDIQDFLIDGLDAHRLVLVNGRVDASLSDLGNLPSGVVVSSLEDAGKNCPDVVEEHYGQYADFEDDAMAALNTAFVQDGAFVYVPKGTLLEKPVFILHVNAGDEDLLIQPRHLFVVEDGAVAQVIEKQHSLTDARTFTNTVTEMYAGRDANLQHSITQNQGENASQVLTTAGYHRDNSTLTSNVFSLSGEVVRNNQTVTPNGEHCESNLFGLVLGQGEMHVDNHTLVDHVHADCASNELYKHILNDSSTAVFNGKVFVHRGSQRIDAYQQNDTMVLTKDADIYTKPELEIYADDVLCSHGATSGQIDDNALFYLRTRGLTERRSRILLLQAFAQEVLDEIRNDAVKEHITGIVRERLESYYM